MGWKVITVWECQLNKKRAREKTQNRGVIKPPVYLSIGFVSNKKYTTFIFIIAFQYVIIKTT